MILSIIAGITRALLAAYGGKLVEQGMISPDDANAIIGAIMVLVTVGWTAWDKYRRHTVPGGKFNPHAEVRKAQPVKPIYKPRSGNPKR